MRMKELDWRGRTMLVRRGLSHSGHIECDGFNASPRELEVLSLKAEGLTYRQIGLKLSISHYTSRNHLQCLGRRNKGDKGHSPTIMKLVNRARELELLNPYAIRGLESILEKI